MCEKRVATGINLLGPNSPGCSWLPADFDIRLNQTGLSYATGTISGVDTGDAYRRSTAASSCATGNRSTCTHCTYRAKPTGSPSCSGLEHLFDTKQ